MFENIINLLDSLRLILLETWSAKEHSKSYSYCKTMKFRTNPKKKFWGSLEYLQPEAWIKNIIPIPLLFEGKKVLKFS